MTLQSLNTATVWPQITTSVNTTPAFLALSTLDAAGEYAAHVFCAREAMTISHVGWGTRTVAGSPTVDTRIETVAVDGTPSGALWATDTNIVSGTLVSNTWTLHALTASASIAAGQMFCLNIVYASGTSIQIGGIDNINEVFSNPYHITNTSGAAVKSKPSWSINVAFGSGATTFYHIPGTCSVTTITNTAFNNTNGSARGLHFKVPFKCRCVGLRTWNTTSTGDYNVALYDDSGTELSSSSTAVDGDHNANSAAGLSVNYFDSPVTLSPATWYRAAIEPSSATNTTIGIWTLPSADYRAAMPGGLNAHYAVRTSAVWDDSTTSQVPLLDILIDQLDDGVAAAAVGHGNMTGGLQ